MDRQKVNEIHEPLDYDELKRLADHIGDLPDNEIFEMLEIVKKREPRKFHGVVGVELLQSLEPLTTKQIRTYVRRCLTKKGIEYWLTVKDIIQKKHQ